MPTNIDQVKRDLERAKREVVRAVIETQKGIVREAYRQVSSDTQVTGFAFGSPTWSGRFLNSHRVRVGSVSPDVAPPHPETVGPGATRWPDPIDTPYRGNAIANADLAMTGLMSYDVVYISNAVPYAQKIERGHSFKAPEGVYGVTVDALKIKYRNVKLREFLPK